MDRAALYRDIMISIRAVTADTVITNDRISREAGLGVVDAQLLHWLTLRSRLLTASELAAVAGLPTSTMTRVVDRLEAAGYLTREVDPQDRRRMLLRPSPAKMAEMQQRYRAIGEATQQLMDGFTNAELAVVLRFQQALLKVSKRVRPEQD